MFIYPNFIYTHTFFYIFVFIIIIISFCSSSCSSNHRHGKHYVSRKFVGDHGDQTVTKHTKGQAQKYVGIHFKLITWNLVHFFYPDIKYVRVSSIFSDRWLVFEDFLQFYFLFSSIKNSISAQYLCILFFLF